MEMDILIDIVAKVMKVDPKEVSKETTFVEDLGADSLDLLRILMDVEEQFNIKLPKDCIHKIATTEDVNEIIKKVKKA